MLDRKKRQDAEDFLENRRLNAQAHLIGAAYEGAPIQEKALVFAFAGREYMVPFSNVWDGDRVTESLVRLDLAERIVSRPGGTSRISAMRRSRVIPLEARAALLAAIHAWFLPEKGYKICIVPFVDERGVLETSQ